MPQTSAWGPGLWTEFHLFAATYTPNAAADAVPFYTKFASKIPCDTCAEKYAALLRGRMALSPNDLADRDRLFEWTWTFHNVVNTLLKKPHISLEEARHMYNL